MGFKARALGLLKGAMKRLEGKYPLKSLALFGSVARGDETAGSDVDILVEFCRPIGIEFVYLADDLEGLLGRKVDLVSLNGIAAHYLKEIETDLVYV